MEKVIMYEKIYRDILQKIKDGIYAEGDMLPSEKELSEQYGVSRITSNKAMVMLAKDGIVQRIQGKGTIVLKNDIEDKQEGHLASANEQNCIGVIVDTIGAAYGEILVRGIERGVHDHGLRMYFGCTYGDEEEETRAINDAIAGGAKGLILMCTQGETYSRCMLDLTIRKFPIVLVDREMQGLDIPCIRTDNYTAAKELTEKLIAKGHKKICFITHSSRNTTTISNRYHAFRDCIAMHPDVQGNVRELTSYQTNPVMRDATLGYDLSEIRKILKEEKENTAFFVVEYKMAIILDTVFRSMGMKKEIATFDGLEPFMDDQHHFLQVIQDEYQMGYEAVRLLTEKMNGEEAGAEASIYIPHKIV